MTQKDSNSLQMEFESFAEAHKATIYSVCYMYAKDKAQADDLFQDTLINLWKGFDSFRGDCAPCSWVYRVSLNTCLSAGRKKRVATVPLELSADVCDASTQVGKNTAMLHARISRLDPFDRAIVLLWLESMPYDEIGAIVGISPKAVGVRLVRIREKLKNMK